MKSPSRRRARPLSVLALALLVALLVGLSGVAAAQTVATTVPPAAPGSAQDQEVIDPPGRVARLSDLQGDVWLFHPDAGEWTSAVRNRPLTSGDRLATDADGRAELRIGSTTLRLDGGSELELLNLDDDRMQLQLHAGSLSVRLRSQEALAGFELLTGEGRFTVERTGRYRFDRFDEASHATVFSGAARYERRGHALGLSPGQHGEFWIDGGDVAQYRLLVPEQDAFASWSASRDAADGRGAAARYVSPEMTGVEDLDRYGRWEDDPEYGALWTPIGVSATWAPYSTGHWAWIAPWGWTWVDDAPWGFAPFHYGRWVHVRNRWCWSPGHYVRRPIYAPALVAWLGGPRLSVAIGVGAAPAVGWVPLAPREVYVPTYRVSPRYVRNVNVTHVTRITNITTIVNDPQRAVRDRDYRNRKFPHAVTVVPATTLAARQPVAPVAERWRDTPGVRELAKEPPRAAVVVAPPAPAPAARAPGTPAGRPPALVRRGEPDRAWERERRGDRDGREERRDGRDDRRDRIERGSDRDVRTSRPAPGLAPMPPMTAAPAAPAAAPVAPRVVAPRGEALPPTLRAPRQEMRREPRAESRQESRQESRVQSPPRPVPERRAEKPAPPSRKEAPEGAGQGRAGNMRRQAN